MNMKATRTVLIVVLFALSLTFATLPLVNAESSERNFLAVVVGVEGGDATNLDNDAQDFANVLTSVYGYPSSNVQLLINSAATKVAVLNALDWLKTQEAKPDGVSIFFSAHGGNNYIHLYDDLLWDYELEALLLELDSHNILVVVSACHSGSFIDVSSSIEHGIVVTACRADESTFDIPLFANSIFVEYFVDRAMSQGLADGNGDGVVSVQEAFNYAYENCADPPGALASTHPQMTDKYGEEYILSSPVHAPWFTNLMAVVCIIVLGYAIRRKKISFLPSINQN